MQFKILNWLKMWAERNGVVVKDWQQVSGSRMDIWYIPQEEVDLWGDFAPRKCVNVKMFAV